MSSSPAPDRIRAVPKALLHDHLDGGLRPRTIVELAEETGYAGLPATDPEELAAWVRRGADRKDLVLYLETFVHTVGVMQTAGAIRRVARECGEDLADDGVVYAEVRFAPEQHLEMGIDPRRGGRGGPRGVRGGDGEPADDPAPHHPHVAADRRALAGDRRPRDRLARPRCGGVRHRGRGGRLPADPAPRRVRARARRQLPPDDPCRRGLRAPFHLGGAAAVRRRAAGPRRADHGRHRCRPRRSRHPRPARVAGARPAHPARALSHVERPQRGGGVRSRSIRSACSRISGSA